LDLFVDGVFASNYTVTLEPDGGNSWRPGGVVRIDIDRTLTSGDHRLKLIVNGDEEVFEFNT
jgi:flagellar protein FlaG